MRRSRSRLGPVALLVLTVSSGVLAAQTVITAPKNKYTPAEDVQIGTQAAAEAEKELHILGDQQATSYIAKIGRRIVAVAPTRFQHREFRYSFKIVDDKTINAFALPGGPTYFNTGMIVAASSEAQVAGVLAHELSHVLLRHGTAQATKATPYQIGELAGALLGALVGGKKGEVIAQGSQLGIGVAFLRFSREYEHQADLLGAQIMAKAGYDPREMANMFRTIAETSGQGAPEFLSSHPDPGNRYEYVMQEASELKVQHPVAQTSEFQTIRRRVGGG